MYKTEQEKFWAGTFGNEYIERNKENPSLQNFFKRALQLVDHPTSLIEFGANIGLNIQAIKSVCPTIEKTFAIEINAKAVERLLHVSNNVFNGSILDYNVSEKYDIVLIKGVLIHINPDELSNVYQKLFDSCGRYILVAEYFNPTPVKVSYRGESDKLFKRDFAGEMMDRYPLRLVDYGFCYKRDKTYCQDDVNWFLLERTDGGVV